ncbi:hypothetical protein MCAMS1_00301 [biofilm metagenome]
MGLMHQHLTLIINRQPAQSSGQGASPTRLSDMDIIFTQALLMDAGSASFKAIKAGEIEGILARLVAIAYTALEPLAKLGCDVAEYAGENRLSYQMLDIMRQLSNKINDCSSGEASHYSVLYHVCSHLATDFLNADFDKAFRVYYAWRISYLDSDDEDTIQSLTYKSKLPVLTDCFYE